MIFKTQNPHPSSKARCSILKLTEAPRISQEHPKVTTCYNTSLNQQMQTPSISPHLTKIAHACSRVQSSVHLKAVIISLNFGRVIF